MNPIMYEMFVGKIDQELWILMGILIICFFGGAAVLFVIEAIIKAIKK